jgi:acetyl-CoA acetyltransferase
MPSPTNVRILAAAEIHNYPANDVYELPGGWAGLSERLYAQAGVGPDALAFAQVYDDYPVMAFIQLEGLGICSKGTAHRFVREHDMTVDGDFPVNTGGGQLSAGQAGASGGMIGVVEGVAQLMGRAEGRQVAGRRGLVSGYGMVAYGRGVSSSVAILERAE